MDDQKFQTLANQALEDLYEKLGDAGDRFGFESDLQEGALKWVSALVKSFKLDWDEAKHAFVLASSGETLDQLIANAISQQTGETVTL